MKNLMVLMLVLGLACVANAVPGLVFTVNGELQPESIILDMPSETVELGMELLAGHNIKAYKLQYELTTTNAEMIRTGMVLPAVFDGMGKVLTNPAPTAQLFQISASQLTSPPLAGPQDLMHGLILHCLTSGNAVLRITAKGATVIDGVTIPTNTVLHEMNIITTPAEPATMALLGLGVLGLLRKRRA